MADFDLFVIGAGSGGVRAARVSAAYGARVAIAEEHKVGGTCVIRGCVPKKLLVYGAHFAEDLDDAAMFGWDVPKKRFDWPTLRDNVLAEVGRLEAAYTDTLTNHNVPIFHERAELTGPNSLRLASGKELNADKILFATGRKPNTDGLGLEAVGVEVGDKGEIKVDADNRSNVPSIFGVGDVTNRVQLTPVAIREGQAFADTFFGNKPHQVDYGCIPSAVFAHPPLAGVGMTERQARNSVGSVRVYKWDFRAMQ